MIKRFWPVSDNLTFESFEAPTDAVWQKGRRSHSTQSPSSPCILEREVIWKLKVALDASSQHSWASVSMGLRLTQLAIQTWLCCLVQLWWPKAPSYVHATLNCCRASIPVEIPKMMLALLDHQLPLLSPTSLVCFAASCFIRLGTLITRKVFKVSHLLRFPDIEAPEWTLSKQISHKDWSERQSNSEFVVEWNVTSRNQPKFCLLMIWAFKPISTLCLLLHHWCFPSSYSRTCPDTDGSNKDSSI